MKLSSLHLEHFRNYERLDFVFPDEPILVLNGDNAQGKTNFLEALYLMALTKSFRMSDRDFLRQFEKDYYRIHLKGTASDEENLSLELCEITEPAHQRVLKKNGVKISAPKFIGNVKVVLFRPEDLQMLTGEPALRRRYLNNILIQTVPGYIKALQLYQKLLTQRNALLLQVKLGASPAYALDLWDEQLAEAGAALLTSRLELVEFLQKQLREGGSAYEVDYESSVFPNSIFCPGRDLASNLTPFPEDFSQKSLYDLLLSNLNQSRPRDTRSGHTSVGPHRDDLKVRIINQATKTLQPVELTASRGELRSALMALKQAEIAWIHQKTGETPLILLDDIFSELDSGRKNDLFDLIPEAKNTQVIITIPEGNPLPSILTTSPKLRSASTVRKIHQGQIGEMLE
ncbi:MAG: DNA replication and repair protein RecF [Candidatus Gracilibacteria bacterium]